MMDDPQSSQLLTLLFMVRSQLVAIAYDAEQGLIPATTSSTTGVAARVIGLVEQIDNATGDAGVRAQVLEQGYHSV